MVIIFAANDYFENGKATEGFPIYLHRVTMALAKLGHNPIIVACGKRNRHYKKEGVEIFTVYCTSMEMPIESLTFGYQILSASKVINKKIREISKQRKIDLIQFTSLQGLAACYYGKTPAVMRLSSYAKVYYATYQTMDKSKVKIMAFFERLAAARCNAVFAPCKITADNFGDDIGRPVSVIETPFVNDVAIYDESIYKDRLEGKKYVLFFGTLIAEKGVLVIADTIQKFLKMHSEYYMVCCGKNALINGRSAVNILQDAAGHFADRFVYLKELSHEKLYPVIQKADFVILPSLVENLSNACIEAMYFKRVVIGTDGISYEQLIDDGISGLLCKPNNADSLLEKMNEAARMSKIQKQEIGKRAKKRIDQLAPEVVVSKLLRFYQYVIDHVSNNIK
ncbi:hypothetical protein C807_02836 [Lachnospiraceae bacterium 28-4]|nr:hypothetical protein C807_02836 [Lachnospiraceae bacterium 28-4]